MLVLSRKVGEKIHIGNDVVVTLVAVGNGKVRLGIEAPADVPVHREEVHRFLRDFRSDDNLPDYRYPPDDGACSPRKTLR